MSARRRAVPEAVFATLLLAFAAEVLGDNGRSPISDSVEVEGVIWPIEVAPRGRADSTVDCGRLTPNDVLIEEDDVAVRVTHVERRLLRVTHALLLDASRSMGARERFDIAKRAAIAYVRSLPPDDRVMVAVFDDSLRLVSAPTADHDSVVRRIEQVPLGNWTGLWDAIYDLLRYLDSLPAQKIVVVLTDGTDTSSLMPYDPRHLLDLVESRAEFTIFPIGIDMVGAGSALDGVGRQVLQRIARSTGGRYRETKGAGGLFDIFDEITECVGRLHYAVYVPEPAAAEDREVGSRRVRVRARDGLPCKVRSAGPRNRRPIGTGASSLRIGRGPAPENDLSIGVAAPRSWPTGDLAESLLWLSDPPAPIVGRIIDVVHELGVLYDAPALERKGKLRIVTAHEPEVRMRGVVLPVPELEHVLKAHRAPEDVLWHLLRLQREGALPRDPHDPLPPFLINGRTFLELREALGAALHRRDLAWREWATPRLVRASLARFDEIASRLDRTRPLDASETRWLDRALVALAHDPPPNALQRHMAEWLGDVKARDVALALESRLIERSLIRPSGEAELARAVANELWPLLDEWLPPATDVRVVCPLVPAFDPARDVVGFFRIVLPQPGPGGPVEADRVPLAPDGYLATAALLEMPGLPASALERLTVAALDHRTLDGRTARRILKRTGARDAESNADAVQVRLELGDIGIEGARLGVELIYRREPGDVVAVAGVHLAGPDSAALLAAAEWLLQLR